MFERFSALVNLMADRSILVVFLVLLNIFEKSVTFSKVAFLRLMSEILVPSNIEVVLVVSRKVVRVRSTLERLVVPANIEEASVTFSNFALSSFRVETLEFLNIFVVFVAFLKSEFERSMVEILEFSKTEVKSSASEIFQEEKSGDVPTSGVSLKARARCVAFLANETSPISVTLVFSKADSIFSIGESLRYLRNWQY